MINPVFMKFRPGIVEEMYKLSDDNSNSKNLIYTICNGEACEKILDITRPYMIKYAEIIGCDFCIVHNNIDYEEFLKQRKNRRLLCIWMTNAKFYAQELLTRYDRVLYIDGDILVLKTEDNIFNEVPEDCFGAFEEGQTIGARQNDMTVYMNKYNDMLKRRNLPVTINWNGKYYNAGVMVASKCHSNAFDLPVEYMYHKFPEQDHTNYNISNNNVKVYELPIKWNRMLWGTFEQIISDCNFMHFAGAWTHFGRINTMLEHIKKLNKLERLPIL